MTKVLIYGAGAIGRGFLAPLLSAQQCEIAFVDTNAVLIEQLRARKRYRAAIAAADRYLFQEVPVMAAYHPGEERARIGDFELVILCVGPRACLSLASQIAHARVVISCENDRSSAIKLRQLSGNERVYFGIPDVITSNTAPEEFLREDPLTVVSEQGTLFLESGDYQVPADIRQLDTAGIDEQWACKLYLHNSPHCMVAYLGAQRQYRYVHDAMADAQIDQIAVGAMEELKAGVTFAGLVGRELADYYAEKELRRFRNPRLFDPISRVAREPLRKLAKGERLIGAAHLALYAGVRPANICAGIRAALEYCNPADPDVALPILRQALGTGEVLRMIANLSEFDPLRRIVEEHDENTVSHYSHPSRA
ncbi:MAG: 2-dehydropantoate 2-reductase N-terminal domain-containing protein [Terriglobales bacterium]